MPAYLSDGTWYTSGQAAYKAAHLYPQHDEYESTATVTACGD